MRYFILTDLEGAAGVDSFTQTRGHDLQRKLPGMKQLAREVTACAEGIRSADPAAVIDVWDGHGSGGLLAEDIACGSYLRDSGAYFDLDGYDAVLFVGQHAMAGTFHAPLCHTYSSLEIAYYKLNGVYIGEFGCRALVAGLQGVPTIFIAGDDKAIMEAKLFVPQIETAVTKWGEGLEAADHLGPDEACDVIRNGAANAVKRMRDIPPFAGFAPPFTLEVRYYNPVDRERVFREGAVWIDERTYRLASRDLRNFPV
ncbi:peptidase M55 D-aminopeptidase [Gordoniibacillus kamchatkensis]|uniref:Peptidase M55 D-aminopeptidase n=1 Tax=Gordoniibacillus kamchatkensis TaxID=1590651 RepID=A0ABR5AFZ7_9BACL|nr:M55 family metallopeptidase [Paenibacillus sp. VKM B-2647]KIL39949.1 peptidase M55 D-aminopeptidase [Paenibacillus sp. VKM B-2647]